MSAILANVEPSFDGIRRYRTRCKVGICSHNASAEDSPLWLTDAVLQVNSSKTLKGIGQATIVLAPASNWWNIIFPNDHVAIYYDKGDGEGWTWDFYGMVDRIEETYQVSSEGVPTTRYHLMCSDFQKAPERTQIYFNSHLAGREDIQGLDFGRSNIGGLGLATMGVETGGTPSDIVQNVIMITFGFGTQFALPPSLRPNNTEALRKKRQEFASSMISEAARKAIEDSGGSYESLRENTTSDFNQQIEAENLGQYDSIQDTYEHIASRFNLDIDQVESLYQNNSLSQVLADRELQQLLAPTGDTASLSAANTAQGAYTIFENARSDSKSSLLDIMDTFTFVERRAIDGFKTGAPVWQGQGSILSILRSLCHEVMNEFFFDLRPMVDGEIDTSTTYSRKPDALGGNEAGDGVPAGIEYVPALVMREYPFSTIDGIDLRDASIGLNGEDGEPGKVGYLNFGAIFSDRPNEPGRHIVLIPNINIRDIASGVDPYRNPGVKILDVAVIHEKEVMQTMLGRSDSDHFNLFEFYSDDLLGSHHPYFVHDLLPILTPIHIMRHGLRVRSVTTRFASFSIAETAIPSNEPAEPEEEEVEEEPVDDFEDPVPPGSVVAPVGPHARRFRNRGAMAWGYRHKSEIPEGTTTGTWVFHQGIDIQPGEGIAGTAAALDIPVRAIADGYVVASAPEGVYSGYGDVVVIKHDFQHPDGHVQTWFSAYTHMSSRKVGWNLSATSGRRRDRRRYTAVGITGVSNPVNEPIKVRKGEQIGTMGNTGTKNSFRTTSRRNKAAQAHLHFEIDTHFPPRDDRRTPRVLITSGTGRSGSPFVPPKPENVEGKSSDPVQWFTDWHNFNLVSELNGVGGALAPEDSEGIEDQDSDTQEVIMPEDDNPAPPPSNDNGPEEGRATPSNIRSRVDAAPTRRQVTRWALLQDHWYQHNLEYLSGRIDMRGSPEIRVGYRLDFAERNMSFYVEGVNHQWSFPDKMQTSLQVTRGQANNPYPLYVMPKISNYTPTETQRRTAQSRLAQYFLIPDVLAVQRSAFIGAGTYKNRQVMDSFTRGQNMIDATAQADNIDFTYNEHVIPASQYTVYQFDATDELPELIDMISALEVNEVVPEAEADPSLEPASEIVPPEPTE